MSFLVACVTKHVEECFAPPSPSFCRSCRRLVVTSSNRENLANGDKSGDKGEGRCCTGERACAKRRTSTFVHTSLAQHHHPCRNGMRFDLTVTLSSSYWSAINWRRAAAAADTGFQSGGDNQKYQPPEQVLSPRKSFRVEKYLKVHCRRLVQVVRPGHNAQDGGICC